MIDLPNFLQPFNYYESEKNLIIIYSYTIAVSLDKFIFIN